MEPAPEPTPEPTVESTPEPEGGDPACWLESVCPACGRLTERLGSGRCAACGAPWERD